MLERVVRERVRGRRRIGGVRVLVSHNAVHSVINRVRVFRNGGVRRRRRHREYRALRYRLVYVGGIAVLFLFVVIRLNGNEWTPKEEKSAGKRELSRRRMGGVRPMTELKTTEWTENMARETRIDEIDRREELGQYRYTEGRKYVWRAGRLRRVARRGAVVLTREEASVSPRKRQRVSAQLARESDKAVRRTNTSKEDL